MKLDPTLIQQALLCGEVHYFEQTESTNDYLLNRYQTLRCGSVCIAEAQTAGRGRRGRQWYSPASQNLYFSMLWRYALAEVPHLASLSLVVALSVADTFSRLGIQDIQLKWPNDIYYQGKKMGGILIETRIEGGECYLVMGIGLNLGMTTVDPIVVTQPWADLTEYALNRTQVAAQLAQLLQQVLIAFPHTPFEDYLPRWRRFDLFYQQPVKLVTPQAEIHGIAVGVNAQGELLLQQQDKITAFAMGEISVRHSDMA